MKKRGEKNTGFWFFLRLGVGTGAVLAFAGWLVFGEGGFRDSGRLAEERSDRAAEIALLRERKAAIQDYLEKLEAKDQFAMEVAARRYGLVGPNEKIYRIKVEPEAVQE